MALEDVEKSQVATQEIQTKFQIGTLSNPVFPDMLRRPATSVGGSLLAAELNKGDGPMPSGEVCIMAWQIVQMDFVS